MAKIGAAVGPHRGWSPGPTAADPFHHSPQEVASAASGGGAAFPEPSRQRLADTETQHIGGVDPAASGQSLPMRKRGVEATGIISLSPAWARAGVGSGSGRWSTG